MATTKIWAIKDSVKRVIEYARNPEKTEYNDLARELHYIADDNKTEWVEDEKVYLVSPINCTGDPYNRIRRCNDPEMKLQVQEEIHAMSAEMKPLRRQIADIKNVLERSGVMREMVEAEEKMRREKLEREYFLNPKEKAELKNTQPKSSEPQAKAPARKDDRAR